jgi:glyoxylase-like metal-dependent hydrolase (beta-lactamase superfamily II)
LEVGGALMRLELLPAREGDCLWIEYPVDGATHPAIIVINGGPRGTGILLLDRMNLERAKRGGTLHVELLVITHIDGDHIAGIIELLEQSPSCLSFGDIWFNGVAQLSQLLGTDQGDRLSKLLRGKPWNGAFGGRAVEIDDDDDVPLPMRKLPGEMKITILDDRFHETCIMEPMG